MKNYLRSLIRHRTLFLCIGTLIGFALSLQSDPDGGRSTYLGGLSLVQGLWAVVAAFVTRKALMDYPEADWRQLFARASIEPTGAGLALVAAAIVFVGLLLVFAPRAQAGDLPAGFSTYGPVLKAEQMHFWPEHPHPALLAALAEQESCPSLKSKSCWNPAARLKSAREEGAGMGQITRAYKVDGSLRFDALTDARNRYGTELAGWSWSNVYQRPDLQLRALVLMSRDAARSFRSAPGMLAFGDAGYNGGVAGVQKERRACTLTEGCVAGLWFDQVEKHCLKSHQPLYGGRSACDINREHVKNVMLVRPAKYERVML